MSDVNTPEYVNDLNQVGNKTWRMTSGDGIQITKTTTDTVDTYKFDAAISKDKTNTIQLLEDGLYAPIMSSRAAQLSQKIDDLRAELEAVKNLELRPTESVTLSRETDSVTGKDYIQAKVNIAAVDDNSIEIKADGLYSRSMELAPGSIYDIERRLKLLEDELIVINQEIDNLKTTALVYEDGTVVPPIVVPGPVNS